MAELVFVFLGMYGAFLLERMHDDDMDLLRKRQILQALEAHALAPDEPVRFQSRRHSAYQAAIDDLLARGHAYRCPCSRKELQAHGGRHPHACRTRPPSPLQRPFAVRFKLHDEDCHWQDQLLGPQETDPLACDPRHVRMTVHAVPQSAELRKRWQLPYGAIIHPMAKLEEPVPVVSFGAAGVLRCRRCRAYINPYVQFLDGGRRWACNFCGQPNDVPVEYFCALDHQGKRKDLAERPELLRGAVAPAFAAAAT